MDPPEHHPGEEESRVATIPVTTLVPRDWFEATPPQAGATLSGSRTSFFDSASNVTLSGAQFTNNLGRHTNLNLTINIGQEEPGPKGEPQRPEGDTVIQPVVQEEDAHPSARGTGRGGTDSSISRETEDSNRVPLRPPTLPPQKSSDIYYRHLSAKVLGYPLWIPEPNTQLPITYQRQGILIGDVGIFTPAGSFDFLFNICLPADDPINPRELPEGFTPVSPPVNRQDIHTHPHFRPNSFLTSTSVRQTERSWNNSFGNNCNLTFESSASEGEILTMPDGAYSEDLGNLTRFKKYLVANAEHWYRYANGIRGREALNGELRLVTGTHKSTTWGMATFADRNEQQDFRVLFRPNADHRLSGARGHEWESSGIAEVRAGPDPRDIEELRMGEESEAAAVYRNQCLFVRTLNVRLDADIWKRLMSELDLGFELENSRPENFDATYSQSRSLGHNTDLSGSGPIFGPSYTGNTFTRGVYVPERERCLTAHPSEAINEMLLAEYPNAKMAITEDWDWMSVLEEGDISLPSPDVLCKRVRVASDREVIYDPLERVVSLRNYKPGSQMYEKAPSGESLASKNLTGRLLKPPSLKQINRLSDSPRTPFIPPLTIYDDLPLRKADDGNLRPIQVGSTSSPFIPPLLSPDNLTPEGIQDDWEIPEDVPLSSHPRPSEALTEEYLRMSLDIPHPQPLNLDSTPSSGRDLTSTELVALAIWGSPERRLTLAQIIDAIKEKYPDVEIMKDKSWTPSSLPMGGIFVQEGRREDLPSEGNYWVVNFLAANWSPEILKKGAQGESGSQGLTTEDDIDELDLKVSSESSIKYGSPHGVE